MSARYITHARNASELRAEFLSDIQRRLDHLDEYLRTLSRNAAEATRIARARQELLSLLDFWKNIEIKDKDQQ